MTMENVISTLEERGIVWQASGFAIIGAISVTLISISVYSELEHWSIYAYRLAVTQMSWAFALAIATTIERIRKMFETRTEIRRQAREKAIAKAEMRGRKEGREEGREEGEKLGLERGEKLGRQEGEKDTLERIRLNMQKQGLQLSPEQEAAIFGNRNGHQH